VLFSGGYNSGQRRYEQHIQSTDGTYISICFFVGCLIITSLVTSDTYSGVVVASNEMPIRE
jgi:hypothetical protein